MQSTDFIIAGGDATLGIPAFKMVDGSRGARIDKATAFPVPVARAASFDMLLEHRIVRAIGCEVKARGGNVLLAPTINLLRHPGWGRAQETYMKLAWQPDQEVADIQPDTVVECAEHLNLAEKPPKNPSKIRFYR